MLAGERGAETGGGSTRPSRFLSTYIAKWLRSARARSTHRGDTLRDSLGYGGDVATRDNTPRDTVSHSMLRLRAGVHESGRPAREIVPGGLLVSALSHLPAATIFSSLHFPRPKSASTPGVQMTRARCPSGKSRLIPRD